jgi:hypothetical protein
VQIGVNSEATGFCLGKNWIHIFQPIEMDEGECPDLVNHWNYFSDLRNDFTEVVLMTRWFILYVRCLKRLLQNLLIDLNSTLLHWPSNKSRKLWSKWSKLDSLLSWILHWTSSSFTADTKATAAKGHHTAETVLIVFREIFITSKTLLNGISF